MTREPAPPAFGILRSAVIRDDAAVFTLLPPTGAEGFCIECLAADDTRWRVALDAPDPGADGTLICRLPLDPGGPALREISLLLRIGTEWHNPERDDTACFLHRLLSTDIKEVNQNLRWFNRIPDLETRFFAARNSLRVIGDDMDLRARCIVSVGYQGVETESAAILDWCMEEYARSEARLDALPDLEARMSLATFWVHLAIAREDNRMFAELSQNVRTDVFPSKFPAIAVYNALCLALLLGGWHLARGELQEAAQLFRPTNKLFKLAALEFPRALDNYRELIGVTQMTYYCQIGRSMAEERLIRTERGIPKLLPPVAWREGSRLRGKDAREKVGKKYEALCAAEVDKT